MQLLRIVRMTATAGFLHEPHPAHVAHSALSAPFVTRPSYLDAAMFLSETAAPAALHMAAATRRFGQSQRPHESAYNVALNTSATFASMCEIRSKLQRQWPAYLRHAMGDVDPSVTDLLTCFDRPSLGDATVVDVSLRIFYCRAPLSFPSMPFTYLFAKPLIKVFSVVTSGGCAIDRNSNCPGGPLSGA